MDEWLIIHTPDGVYCWDLGTFAESEREGLVDRARILASVPAVEVWPGHDAGYAIMLTHGEPHPTLMERATVGTAADLAKVDRAKVQAHKDGRELAVRQARIDAAKDVLAALDPADLAKVIASTRSR